MISAELVKIMNCHILIIEKMKLQSNIHNRFQDPIHVTLQEFWDLLDESIDLYNSLLCYQLEVFSEGFFRRTNTFQEHLRKELQ